MFISIFFLHFIFYCHFIYRKYLPCIVIHLYCIYPPLFIYFFLCYLVFSLYHSSSLFYMIYLLPIIWFCNPCYSIACCSPYSLLSFLSLLSYDPLVSLLPFLLIILIILSLLLLSPLDNALYYSYSLLSFLHSSSLTIPHFFTFRFLLLCLFPLSFL